MYYSYERLCKTLDLAEASTDYILIPIFLEEI